MPVRSDALSFSNVLRQLRTNNAVLLLSDIKNNLYDKISISNYLASLGYKNDRGNSVITSLRSGLLLPRFYFWRRKCEIKK